METTLYIFLFSLTALILYLGYRIVKNAGDRFLIFIITGVFFLVLMIQSFNIETIYYDTNVQQFVVYRLAENGYEYLLPFGFCLIASAFSLLNAIILIPDIWNKNLQNKDLKGF